MTTLGTATILRADARQLPLPDASVDSIVCDPPYALPGGFMGRSWDRFDEPRAFQEWCEVWAREAYRVLKPGAFLIAFGGSRTWHRLTCAIEDAGFEIRDSIGHGHMAWTYGQGFAKGIDVSKAIDQRRNDHHDTLRVTAWLDEARTKASLTNQDVDAVFGFDGMARHWTTQLPTARIPTCDQWERLRNLLGFGDEMDAEVQRLNERKGAPGEAWQTAEVVATQERDNAPSGIVGVDGYGRRRIIREIKAPNSAGAAHWQGWNTSLKPAWEPIVVARKPLVGTVAANVLQFGTGGLNIDGCRVGDNGGARRGPDDFGVRGRPNEVLGAGLDLGNAAPRIPGLGRWPTNVVLSHVPKLDEQGEIVGDACADGCVPGCPVAELDAQSGVLKSGANPTRRSGDKFRDAYGDFAGQAECVPARGADEGGASRFFPTFRYEAKAPDHERPRVDGIAHPTVKPLTLIRFLARLVTRPGGLILDPFSGSGTTLEAALLEGFNVIAGENDADYLPLIQYRLDRARRRLQPGVARLAKTKPAAQVDGQGDLFADLIGGAA